MLEDLRLVENRGSGISAMIHALREANLEPPRFHDRRASFLVSFRSHTLMNPQAVAWLNQFADKPLNDGQRVALAYLRRNRHMTNSDYQRLNHVDSVSATRELRGLVQSGLAEQHGTRGGAYYTLNVPAETERDVIQPRQSDEETILAYVRDRGQITNSECRKLLGVDGRRARYLLGKLCDARQLRPIGERRVRRYVLPERYRQSIDNHCR